MKILSQKSVQLSDKPHSSAPSEFSRRDVLLIASAFGLATPPATGQTAITAGSSSDSDAWYATSYRKLFFDYHTHSSAVGLASAFNPESWARRLQEANAQAVSVFTKCGRGWSYYRKGSVRHIHPLLPVGLDMLEVQIRELHKRGLRALGYYHTFGSEAVAQEHPEWIERDHAGKPRGQTICMLGPLLQQHMLPHVKEIVGNYDVDAMFFDGTFPHAACYCESCRERFRKEAGAEIPRAETDPLWRKYAEWYNTAYEDTRRQISDAVHEARPGLPVSYNWVYSVRQPQALPAHVGTLMGDIRPEDQVFNGSYHARYWATCGRPFDIMNSAFLQWWGDWGSKPAQAMQQEVATIIANGGLTWIGYQMSHTFDVQPAVMEQLGKALAFVKEREHLLKNAVPVPNVAVLVSTRAYYAGGGGRFRIDEVPQRGAHRLLLEAGIPHHFVNEDTLARRLKDYRAVVLPDVRHVPASLVSALEGYVNEGGVVLATYRSGAEDPDGKPLKEPVLAKLFGAQPEGRLERPEAYIEVSDPKLKKGALDMPHLVHGEFLLARPTAGVEVAARLLKPYVRADGQFLLRSSPAGEDSGYPAITRRRLGKGTAIYIAGQVFRGYQTHGQWCLKPLIANLLNGAMGQPLVELESPLWLEIALMKQDRRTIVHLVNHHSNRPIDGNNVCAEQIPPVHNVVLNLAMPARPARVRLEPGAREPRWTHAGQMLRVIIPEIRIHTAVVVEPRA